MSKRDNLVLIGLMGTGKTTIGREAARRLGFRFVDTDQEIVRRAGQPVAEMFATRGEAAFRALEAEVVRDLAAGTGQVIATGGGAVMNPTSFAALRETGLVVALTATTDVLWDRLNATADRPLLAGASPRSRLEELAALRAPVYAQADQVIDTSTLDVESATAQVCAAFGLGAARRLPVDLGERSYPIFIGEDILSGLGLVAREVSQADRVLLVSNQTVAPLYGEKARRALQLAGFTVAEATLPDGEEHKTLLSVERLYDAGVAAGLGRDGLVVALGGGVIGDTTGFFAATYMRGIRFLQVPTTLLAQIDSSVGGKVGVNHREGKNLIGAFHQPVAVLGDISTLRTLPERELSAGLAEVIKTAVIGDESLFQLLESTESRDLAHNAGALGEVAATCCRIKADVVRRDEREAGPRAALNLGHTVGHAVEVATEYRRYLHGEAVAIGLITATLISERLGLCERGLAERVRSAVAHLGLPVAPAGVSATEITSHLAKDKKSKRGKVRWVLPRAIGSVTIDHEVDLETVVACLEEQLSWRP